MNFLSGRGGRVEARLVKNETTTKVEKSFKAFSFSTGTVEPHNITIVESQNNIGLEV